MQALLFDFDGLIVDTESPEFEVWAQIFAEYHVEFPVDYWINALGRGAGELHETPMRLLERLSGKQFDHAAVHSEAFRRRIAIIETLKPLPGVEALIESARREGVRLAVVSSSKHEWVDGHLARLGMLNKFEFSVCSDDVGRAKPAPDLYLEALRRLGIGADAAVALEDSPNGVAAARAAGIFVVAVPNAVTAQLDLSQASAVLATLDGTMVADLDRLVQAASSAR